MSVERRKISIALGSVIATGAIIGGYAVENHSQEAATYSRLVIGPERTSDLERVYFSLKDNINRRLPENKEAHSPFVENIVEEPAILQSGTMIENTDMDIEILRPAPLILPEIKQLSSQPIEGEGIWTTEGLPNSSPDNILMAKTFLRPDKERPNSKVGVMLFDKRRIRLNITGGTVSPGIKTGVKGPGKIAEADLPNLLAAWNGGWQGTYDNFGMYADGKEYKPMVKGYASVVTMRDGAIKIGEWGRVFTERTEDMVAIRQNVILMIEKGQISQWINAGNDTWGYVEANSRYDITWRSGIGLSKNGDLMVFFGEHVNAQNFARGAQALGAQELMTLDNNTPMVFGTTFSKKPDGSPKGVKFMSSMYDKNAERFLEPNQKLDFMYVTQDESNYR